MVDPINPSGSIQGIPQTSKASKSAGGKPIEEIEPSSPVDEVSLSEEALTLVQAQATSEDIADSLSHNGTLTLASDIEALKALV